MLRGDVEADARGTDFASGLLLTLTRHLPDMADGRLLALQIDDAAADDLRLWSDLTGHAIVENLPIGADAADGRGGRRIVIRKGRVQADPVAAHEARQRLWIYTNFHCNLACDYCCVRSSPTATPFSIPVETVRELAADAPAHGIRRIILTGGEPFVRDDIDDVVLAAAEHLPVTLLTNAMLFSGRRRPLLERLPRDRVVLQVSLDSPTPDLHDHHRGDGSWQKAWDGIKLARSLGFRVRVAATCAHQHELDAMDRFLDEQGIPEEDRVLRPLARLGEAEDNDDALALSRADVVPELTYSGRGVYWHPVGIMSEDFRVAGPDTPIHEARNKVEAQVARDRATGDRMAEVFVCS